MRKLDWVFNDSQSDTVGIFINNSKIKTLLRKQSQFDLKSKLVHKRKQGEPAGTVEGKMCFKE